MSQRLYRKSDLRAIGVPYCDAHLLRLERDGKFPKRFKLIEDSGQQGLVGWSAEAVDRWIERLVRQGDSA